MIGSKAEYRAYFADVSVFLRMQYFLDKAGIHKSNFSRFMKDQMFDYLISLEKLDSLYQEIHAKIT